MKRVAIPPLVLALVSLAGVAPLQSQAIRFGIGAGGIIPSGQYGGNDQVGWHLIGMGESSVGDLPVSIRADAMYGRTTHQGGIGGSTRLAGMTADLVWHVRSPTLLQRFYLLGGPGLYTVRVSVAGSAPASETKPAFAGGLGGVAGLGTTRVFGEARYISVRTNGRVTDFILLSAGVTFRLQ